MALEVDITKKLDGFFMHMQFRAEQEIFALSLIHILTLPTILRV